MATQNPTIDSTTRTAAVSSALPSPKDRAATRSTRRLRRQLTAIGVAVALAVTATGVVVVTAESDGASVPATAGSSGATADDLRYAAEWARRLESMAPQASATSGGATYRDLMQAAMYAPPAED